MASPLTIIEKCTGAMLASAIGDALGWPNEFRANNVEEVRQCEGFVSWTRRCRGANWHYEKIAPGEYSDDTQMILAVARSIITGNWEYTLTYYELPFWLEYQRGGGGALLRAANSCKKGMLIWQTHNSKDYFYAGGNGAVMRILPHVIAASRKDEIGEVIENVIRDSIITHGHPRAILGATCYAYALNYLLKKESLLGYGELVSAIIKGKNVWGEFPTKEKFGDWIRIAKCDAGYDYIKEWNSVLGHMMEKLNYINTSIGKGLLIDDQEVLEYLGCFGKENGAGDVAILAAIYFVSKYASSPVLGIKAPAFWRGIDTDTIASITGGLLGMLCGEEWIPVEWKRVQDFDCIVKITDILLADDMTMSAKRSVENIKNLYTDWESTPIGKIHYLDTLEINQNKNVTVKINKWESTLGQTLYIKEYIPRKSIVSSEVREKNIRDTFTKTDAKKVDDVFYFILGIENISYLLDVPEMQKMSFKKVMKILQKILQNEETNVSIAKEMKVDVRVVEQLGVYTKRMK